MTWGNAMMAASHVCAFCTTLQRTAIRRRDPALLEAAIRLRETHAGHDAEREAFGRANATAHATAQPPRSSVRITLPGGNHAV